MFKRAVLGRMPRSRLAGIVALTALIPVGLVAPALASSVAAATVVVAVAGWETHAGRQLAASRP